MEHDEPLNADSVATVDAASPERRCILTHASGPSARLIRLAVGPDNQIAADFAGKLPGRGAWISADRALLDTAIAKGKLKGALARAFKSNSLHVPDDLADQIAAGLERRALDRLGLENRAGNLIWGHERIGDALLKGRLHLLLHAADARPDGMGKLEAKRRGASPATRSIVLPAGRDQLSMALGRENVVHAAISDAASAARVIETLERWAAYGGTAVDDTNETVIVDDMNDDVIMDDGDEDSGETAIAVAPPERH
ncbi:MAG: hypothetical protein RL490_678 [Pseudomonadota bacterium]|jgi:predicted RNA-binding protein YlxR (DUF448 family)